jgi:hypothetical protein
MDGELQAPEELMAEIKTAQAKEERGERLRKLVERVCLSM